MKDVFPIPPLPALSRAVQPLADRLGLYTLPLHVHEILLAALFYTAVQVFVSPRVSNYLVPHIYKPMNRVKKVNWDSHVVSLVQSLLINTLALLCMGVDQERKNMDADWKERVFGYIGTPAMVSALACGYFLWDLVVTLLNFDVFGPGLLAHALSALTVFSFGFVRPCSSSFRWARASLTWRALLANRSRDPFSTTTAATSSSTSCPPPSSTPTGSLTSSA